MALTLSDNATTCGDQKEYVAFRDSRGEYTYVLHEELDNENMEIFSNPDVLTVFKNSIEDYLDGRFVDFEF